MAPEKHPGSGSLAILRRPSNGQRPGFTASDIRPEEVTDEAHAILDLAQDRNRPQPDDTLETGDAPLSTGTGSSQQ